jgi:hypothetical protein
MLAARCGKTSRLGRAWDSVRIGKIVEGFEKKCCTFFSRSNGELNVWKQADKTIAVE